MSNLSGLPPASVIRAASIALTQDIAVRLIRLPDTLQSNAEPLKLTGTVRGQSADGSLRVETDRGVINILLKDRGNLPTGQRIEIDIPAGRPPQQAAIRNPPAVPASPPSLASHLQAPAAATGAVTAATANASLRLDRSQPLNVEDLAEALASAKSDSGLRPAAPLQAGQILRLIPISSGAQTSGSIQNPASFTPEELFASLMNMIGEAVDLPIQTKQNLIQVLSRIDISTLLPASDEGAAVKPQESLQQVFQKLVQDVDLPETIKLQNAPLQNTPASLFNSARMLDVKILAFQNGNFQAALSQARSPGLNASDFVVLSQPTATGALPLPAMGQNSAASVVPLPPLPAAPVSILGQVAGFTPQGQPIVSLALPGSPVPQNYAVQFVTNNIVEGSTVIVSPLPVTQALAQQAGFVPFPIGADQALASWTQPEIWDSLQTLIGAVTHINPGMAQAMTQMLPHAAAPQNMGALSMFFLSVMRTGDLDTWIGLPAINLLKQSGKVDILRALAGESIVSSRLEAAVLPNDWRAAIFPFWHDQQVHKLPLYYKQWNDENDHDTERERRKKMRFMFELKLSRMGPVQVDGFMQQEKLDMILRTKSIIGPNMQEALRKTYYKAMERSNLSGEITFQFKPEQWVQVEIPSGALA